VRLEISRGTQFIEWTSDRSDRLARARVDARALCETLREHIARGTLPPDEAYWWTRVVVAEASLFL
jgi:hypothetical protein